MAVPPQPTGNGLVFNGMTDLGIDFGFNLEFWNKDKAATTFLCIGSEDNRVEITGTKPKGRQPAVLKAIDDYGKWGEDVSLWMTSERAGVLTARTRAYTYKTHVKPFYGKPYEGELTISGISTDDPKMTYPGNGKGRLLSPKINGRYYFIYAGKFETDNKMRGFDCTSFPMALFSVKSLPTPGYGKQLCQVLGATECDLEQIQSSDLQKRFQEDVIDFGYYVLFSEGHVMLYNSNGNYLYEFTYGGFKGTSAGARPLNAKHNLWWMRKLGEDKAAFFR
jgi:hypothetical protein